ncbi:MAG: 2-oxoacid:acceptor oxidoreductase family protein, partial [Calditrichia bacterium]
ETPEKVWATIPAHFQKIIVENDIKIFYIDAFKIARDEASDPELQLRMQGIAFQGAFFAASPLMKTSGLSEEKLFQAIRDQLQSKFGSKGARVVEDNLRVVKRGYDEIHEIVEKPLGVKPEKKEVAKVEPDLPVLLKRQPQSKAPATDIHRFWEQTGNFYIRGMGSDVITDPFIGLSLMPAVSSIFRDMTGIRFEHPEWIGENCTACGNCYTVCPDTAIPGLVNDVSQILETALKRVQKNGNGDIKHLPRAVRQMESKLRALFNEASENDPVEPMISQAIEKTIEDSGLDTQGKQQLQKEFSLYEDELSNFQVTLTRPYYTVPEKKEKNSGGLFSITINPYTCKGCMECVEVCDDDALRPATQTKESVAQMRKTWEFWLDLPNTPEKYIRIDNLEEGIGALETLLLDKEAYLALASGDGACLGCGEKSVIHLFTSTVEALMQPRIKKHVAHLDDLIQRLEKHIQMKLVEHMDVSDSTAMEKIVDELKDTDLTLAGIASKMENMRGSEPIDQEWLRRVTQLVAKLKHLKWKYTEGITGKGRSPMGMINATGCTSVWGSTYPFNPYPFPWANHLFQDSPSMALGVFEGHMAKMAEGFKAIRMAELELEGKYNPAEHDEFFTYFNWHQFSDEEWLLCPPVVAMGGDGAMYDIGFQNVSRALISGKPIKIFVVDTQVYSNTGGQACTSGFFGQISDMAQYGKAIQGKQEVRKEIGLIAMAHRTTYVMQASLANTSHMIEGFIQGLMARRPALFNLY